MIKEKINRKRLALLNELSLKVNSSFFYDKFYNNAVDGELGKLYEKDNIICSMTTIPARIQFVKYPILSALHQTVRPHKIILYLGKELFSGHTIPPELIDLQKYGLEIKYVEDKMVHTKYYYAFLEHKDSLVITIDDDILYNKDLFEIMIKKHIKYPKAVICSRAHGASYAGSTINPYMKWDWNVKSRKPDMRLVATGVGSVLYEPRLFNISPCQEDVFLKLSPNNDDLWLKAIEYVNEIPVYALPGRHWYTEIRDSQKVSLNSSNVHKNRNDEYISNLIKYFDIKPF